MKKIFRRTFITGLCSILLVTMLAACAGQKVPQPDGSIPIMYGDSAETLLENPDRGLRMECQITLGSPLEAYPNGGAEPFAAAQSMIDKYKSDKPTLSQVYVYLSNYRDKPLDDLAFSQMKQFFELFRDNHIRMLLRFAYGTESVEDAPYETVKIHLGQLDAWFNENEALIQDTLYCMQTGIIGFWGEGHHNDRLKNEEIPNVIADVCALAPEGIYTQVRTYDFLTKVREEDLPKVGIHDDYIIGELDHGWAFIPKNRSNVEKFNQTTEHAKYTVNDGEMPWGVATYNDDPNGKPLDRLDGKKILKQLSSYSMTSFSLTHNYREGEERTFSMYAWKSQYLSYKEAKRIGISVNPNLFKNSRGEPIKLSLYDIIRYHLGYQLVLSDYTVTDSDLQFSVINYGFAAPLNFNYFALVCKDKTTGALIETEISSYDKKELLSGVCVSYDVKIPENAEPLGVKLSAFKGRTQCVRFANATAFENGIQYFR